MECEIRMAETKDLINDDKEWLDVALNVNRPLPFDAGLELREDLDDGIIPKVLTREFENNGISLSPDATISIEEKGNSWLITSNRHHYPIKKTGENLSVYGTHLGLALIDRDYTVLWANQYHKGRFPGLIGKTCYRFVNRFDKLCAWCPVKLAREDGLAHLALTVSPKTELERELVYSQIVAVPHERDESGKVVTFLEMIFDFTKPQIERYRRGGRLHSFCGELSDKILNVTTEDDIFYLILFGAVSEDGLGSDEAEIVKLERETEDSEYIISQRYVLRNEDLSSQNAHFKQMTAESSVDTFVGMLMSKVQVEEPGTRLCDFTPFSEEIMNSGSPVRINSQEVATVLSEQERASYAILFLRSKESNSFLSDEKLIDLHLFLSSIQRVYDIRRRIDGIQIATKNLDNFFSQWKEEDRRLFSAIPLAIGKIHNLRSICGKINESTSMLRDLHPNSDDYSIIHGNLITNLTRCVSDLSGIANSMQSILKMSSPNFREVFLFKVVEKMEWTFEQDLKKDKIAIYNKVPQELKIKCDEELISQVFYNLVENSIRALRFAQRKDKRIEIGLKIQDDKIVIQFYDNGPGIAPYDVPRIWNRFFSTRSKGTGLGLYFVKHVIEFVHKGRITVKSEWGDKTTFTIALPKTQTS